MRTIIVLVAFLIVASSALYAQSTHQLPFASYDNKIELTVSNTGAVPLPSVSVEAKNIPSWLEFVSPAVTLTGLSAQSELPAIFTFNVDKSAPVGQSHTLIFQIKSSDGELWTKEITLSVTPPERFELFQNYPNPFNPSTTIAYQLPEPARVILSIYNLLGQMVERPVDIDQVAGYHEVSWNAWGYASGFYVYELRLIKPATKTQINRKRMVLLK